MYRTGLMAAGLIIAGTANGMARDAQQTLDAAGVRGGLVVVVGCDRPAMLADLHVNDAYLIHGLDRDPTIVANARDFLLQKGLYGRVTVSLWKGSPLPFVDESVNLILTPQTHDAPADDEIERVLAPNGIRLFVDSDFAVRDSFQQPRPATLDDWTHFLHDASNNAVSRDTVVDPPQGLRWTCGPKYGRSHEHFASTSGMVTSGGRVFYIIDEGPTSSVYLPPDWKLVARDAFSGVLLWKRSIENWESHLRGFRSGPPEISRRIVATPDVLFVALDYGGPAIVLDTATGKEIATLADTVGARELLLDDGVVYVLADDMTPAQHAERRDRINQISPTLEIWYRYPREAISMYGTPRIVAVRAHDAKRLWKKAFDAPGEVLPATMAVNAGRVCVQTTSHIVCLNGKTGGETWRYKRPVATSRFSWSTATLVIKDKVVLSLDRVARDNADETPPARGTKWLMNSGLKEALQEAELVALALDDGKELWRAMYSENYNTPGDVFVIDGTVWTGNLRRGTDPGFTEGRDLHTGHVTVTIPAQKAWGHHRCYRNKATVKWLLVGRGGIQFVDPATGHVHSDSWFRGTCQYGAMPANGMLYVPQHSCACQPKEMLVGLNALTPRSAADLHTTPPKQLEQGPAFGDGLELVGASSAAAIDWPTYRGNASRSGYQDVSALSEPRVAWTTQLVAPITAPVVANQRVFVAETDRHTLHVLSAANGRMAWNFTADGRIDSPPTVCGGLCLFGTRSGYVYCLRTDDGTVVWQFRAAPVDRRVFAYEQLESAWPVCGSILVDTSPASRETGDRPAAVAYFAAGRSSHLDGGIHLYALDVATGRVLRENTVGLSARQPDAKSIRQGALPDILSLQDGVIWMRGLGIDRNLMPAGETPHLFAARGFLDDVWWHRTYWLYGTEIGGGYSNWPLAGNIVPAGRLLVMDNDKHLYGYGRMRYRLGDGHVRPNATDDYKLFAEAMPTRSISRTESEKQQRQQRRSGETSLPYKRQFKWTADLPFVARSIVLTQDALIVGGGPSLPHAQREQQGGTLWIVDRDNGTKRTECPLSAAPVLDGLASTEGGIVVSTLNGSVERLRDGRSVETTDR